MKRLPKSKPEIRMPKSERNPKRRKPEKGLIPDVPADIVYKLKGQSMDGSWDCEEQIADYRLREDHPGRPFDLGERTARFGEEIIRFAQKIPQNSVNNRLISQCVGAGTSIGANYCEADDAVSRKEFKKFIGTCRKESKETKYWLRMIAVAEPSLKQQARQLWREAKELNLIFGTIFRKP
jgi:four helix bundle protein